ncbi:hypothetical protein GR410_002809 [Salmonella enterica]|nr:hypothetical protein [Salmonella enterica]EDK1730545.1 hypothetical protein [Salmonella enterica subsp. enterica serovar Infantis]ECC7073177.1 hypothetical protein [Salmonella enterica]EDZ7654475.1 hypothetical protein [Salmonella enterica]EEJ5857211.1 hypothetical protein [Salmonella enterica]
MLLHRSNIDICQSLNIGNDNDGHNLRIRIDKLTVVSDFLPEEEKREAYSKLEEMNQRSERKYRVEYIKNKKEKPYRKSLNIYSRKKNSPVLLHIDYVPKHPNTGGLRLDFNPQHMTKVKIDELVSWINGNLGEIFYRLLVRAWVTRIDVALDVYNCKLDDYLWGLKNAGKGTYYDTENGLPGVRIGSNRSLLHIHCYEKVNARRDRKLILKDRAKLININLDEHKRFLRIEARYKPGAKPTSKKKDALMLSQLLEMKNPFKRLQVYSNSLGEELLTRGCLTTLPKEPSVIALKASLRQQLGRSRLNALLARHKTVLFDEREIWNLWPRCVEQLSSIYNLASAYGVLKGVANRKDD